MKTNSNEQAYPCIGTLDLPDRVRYVHNEGLTKREYFAAMAMQGLCANAIPGNQHSPKNHAREAVNNADALIVELNKSGET